MKTVVAMFETRADAEQAAQILTDEGFERGQIEFRSGDWSPATSRPGETRTRQSWWEWLFGESDERSDYTDALRQGGAVLSVSTTDDGAELARILLEGLGADVDEEDEDEGDTVVADERSIIGQRPVVFGVVRTYTWVAGDADDLRAEAPEESPEGRSGSPEHEREVRRQWQATASELSYEDWRSAYDFGHALGGNPRYSGRDWASVEPEARRAWEERNPDTWDRFKAAIQYAWDRIRGTGRRAA
jgi:hypothetical protein